MHNASTANCYHPPPLPANSPTLQQVGKLASWHHAPHHQQHWRPPSAAKSALHLCLQSPLPRSPVPACECPPSLLCNPHHGLIALCNHCKLLSPCTPTLPLPLRYRSHLIPSRLHHLPAGCPSFPSYPPVNQPPPTARESPSCPHLLCPAEPLRSPPTPVPTTLYPLSPPAPVSRLNPPPPHQALASPPACSRPCRTT